MKQQNTLRALWCLRETTRESPMGSRHFAEIMWPKDDERYTAKIGRAHV